MHIKLLCGEAIMLHPKTVPGKPSDDVAPGTLSSILKKAQLKR